VSQENIELVKRLLTVYNERSFAENADLIDPDIVWDLSALELPDSVRYTGRAEFRKFIETWEEGFSSEEVEAEEILDADDRVLVMILHRGLGKTSGAEVSQRYAMVWTFRDGRAVRMDMYATREEALEAIKSRAR
jgi:ketosteroid isomerase-like protein